MTKRTNEESVESLRAQVAIYQRELDRVYREHPELRRPVEDMGEEITTP